MKNIFESLSRNKHYILPGLLILAAAAFCSIGLNWGLPGASRTGSVFPPSYRTDPFYNLMNEEREEIYKLSNNSPMGRLQNRDGSTLSPILESMGVTDNESLIFTGQKKILAGFIRPYLIRSHHTDEQMTIASLSRMKPRSLDFNPRMYQYGGLYIYGMGGYYAALNVFRVIKLKYDPVYYLKNPEEMGKFFLAGRVLNIAFLALTLAAVFVLARRFYGLRSAYAAITLLGFCPALVFQSHIMKPYVAGTLFLVLCVYYSMKSTETDDVKDHVISGLFAGLSAAVMPLYGLILITPLICVLMNRKKNPLNFLLPAASFTVVFLLANPYWIINFRDVVNELSVSGKFYATDVSGLLRLPRFILVQGELSMSGILFGLCAIAFVSRLFRPKKHDIALLVSAAVIFVFFSLMLMNSGVSIHNTRFFLPACALLIIIGVSFIGRILSKKLPAAAAVYLLVFLLEIPASVVLAKNFALDASDRSTRLLAGKWIDANARKGASIGFSEMPEPAHAPPFNFSNYRITVIRKEKWELRPEYLIFTHEVPPSFAGYNASGRYKLAGFFPFSRNFLGAKFDFGRTHLNSDVFIFKRDPDR